MVTEQDTPGSDKLLRRH